jgi:hypothetical protein
VPSYSGTAIEVWFKTQIMENDKKNAVGDDQRSFAGTNPDYGQPANGDNRNAGTTDEEAQNVADSGDRLSGEAADRARQKAN